MNSLEDVREGMDVIDASGEKVGTVKAVKMGDPQAVTAEGQQGGERTGIVGTVIDAMGDNNMPDEQEERLLRLGYIEVDGVGLSHDFVEAADAVEGVTDDTVRLNIDRRS